MMDVMTKPRIEEHPVMKGLRLLVTQLPDVMGRWYLLTSEAGMEKVVLQNLRVLGHEAYLPVWRRPVRRVQTVWVKGKRKRLPINGIETGALFAGYLFVRVQTPAAWASILSAHGVRRVAGVGARPAPVRRGVVEVLRAAELAGLNEYMTEEQVDARLAGMKPGDPVLITLTSGLADLKAIYCEVFDDERVVVLVSLCGRESRVKVLKSRLSAGPS